MIELELWLPNYLFFIFSPLPPSIMHMYTHLFSQRREEDPLLCICFRDSSRKTCKNKFELEIYKYIFFPYVFFFSVICPSFTLLLLDTMTSRFSLFFMLFSLQMDFVSPSGLDLFPLKTSSAFWKAKVADLFRSIGLAGITPADRCFQPDGESLLNHV